MPENIPDVPPPTFRPEKAFGPWLVGASLDFVLTGVIICMVIDYCRTYWSTDRKTIKIMVLSGLVLSLLKSLQVFAIIWHKLITGFASYRMALTSSPWFSISHPLSNVIICLLAQTFFLLRLRVMVKSAWQWTLIPIVLCMLLSLGSHIAIVAKLVELRSYHDAKHFKQIELISISSLIITDFMITAYLCFCLFRSKTGIQKTDSLISKLILISWSTAAVPTLCDILKLALFFGFLGKRVTWVAFSIAEPKLYIIAVMVTLNLRQSMRNSESVFLSSYPRSGSDMPTSRRGVVTTIRFADPSTYPSSSSNQDTTDPNQSDSTYHHKASPVL